MAEYVVRKILKYVGKDQSCQFEGPWQHLAILAAKILAHPNTQRVCPNLYRPESGLTPEQEDSY
jgi:hypothetical protein